MLLPSGAGSLHLAADPEAPDTDTEPESSVRVAGEPDASCNGDASTARIYDALLGGKDNFAADRAAARRLVAVVPGAVEAAWANRDFLARAARFLAGPAGIDQFLDIGAGLPGAGAVHEAARAVNPQARVVCADNDPVVTVCARAVLAGVPGVTVVEGDVRYPRALLTIREVRDVIDFSRPVAVVLGDVLPFVSADDDPWEAVQCLARLLPEGSYLVISHAAGDTLSTAAVQGVRRVYDDALASWTPRSLAEVTWFLAGTDVEPPGVLDVARWRHRARGRGAPPVLVYGGVGRVRGRLS